MTTEIQTSNKNKIQIGEQTEASIKNDQRSDEESSTYLENLKDPAG